MLEPEDRKLLLEIYREVGETRVAVKDLGDKVNSHLKDDDIIHDALRNSITGLQTEHKAGTLKHRIAIGLGLAGVGSGSAAAADMNFIQKVMEAFLGS